MIARTGRRLRRAAIGAAVVATLLIMALEGASWFFRFEPFAIPGAFRAPPVPAHGPGGLTLRYTGVAGYEVTDGETVILMDPVVTRPSTWAFVLEPVVPDVETVKAVFPEADYVLVNHAHHDHAADAATIALTTGATVVGSPSALNLARAEGVPEGQLMPVPLDGPVRLGTFEIRAARGRHAPYFGIHGIMAGEISAEPAETRYGWQYRQDGVHVFHLAGGGTTLLFHPPCDYIGDRLPPADTVIFGIAGRPLTAETVQRLRQHSRPARLIPTHWDNFFQPRSKGLSWLPMIDLDGVRAILDPIRGELPSYLLDYDQQVYLPSLEPLPST